MLKSYDRIISPLISYKGKPFKGDLTRDEFRRIQLVQMTNLLSIISYLLFGISYIISGLVKNHEFLVSYSALSAILFLPNILIIKKGYYTFSKYYVLILLTASLFTGVFFLFHNQFEFQLFLLIYAFIAVLIFENKRIFVAIYATINVCLFLFFELFFDQIYSIYNFPSNITIIYKLVVIVSCFFIVSIILIMYDKMRSDYEKILLDQSSELQELNSMKDRILSIISHDLRNPLYSIFHTLNILEKKMDQYDNEKRRNIINSITYNSRIAHNLLENLLVWSRVKTKKEIVEYNSFNIYDIVKESKNLYNEDIKRKELSVKLNIDKTINITSEKNIVSLVIRNIISNSIKFTPVGGKITISYNTIENGINELVINDTGIGISKDHLSQIFNMNQYFTSKGTDGEKGSGLGLFLCRESIHMINGEITVKSDPGKGSTFIISFPDAKDNMNSL